MTRLVVVVFWMLNPRIIYATPTLIKRSAYAISTLRVCSTSGLRHVYASSTRGLRRVYATSMLHRDGTNLQQHLQAPAKWKSQHCCDFTNQKSCKSRNRTARKCSATARAVSTRNGTLDSDHWHIASRLPITCQVPTRYVSWKGLNCKDWQNDDCHCHFNWSYEEILLSFNFA